MATMIVTNTPAKDLAYTNFSYCSPSDLSKFSVPGSKLFLAIVGDTSVLSIGTHDSIPNGHIALNAIQRRHARVSTGDTIPVSRFVPPDDFNLALLTLELEFVKKGTKEEQVDAVLLSKQIQKRFINQIVNGPEVLSKFVGETEKNVRDLFADAEQDQKTRGDQSDLYVFIFDEIDAICNSRGSTKDGTGVHDSIVNKLLTKIDGVESLNNVLVIGMTNRKDLLDEALMRSTLHSSRRSRSPAVSG